VGSLDDELAVTGSQEFRNDFLGGAIFIQNVKNRFRSRRPAWVADGKRSMRPPKTQRRASIRMDFASAVSPG